uniref:C-type lectin domain-containing protein n=1 Tax=Chrysemys picta bellii TaxID=8478 RepID=A0A8C3H5S1_CHRPI
GLEPRAHRWAVQSVGLNLILIITVIIFIIAVSGECGARTDPVSAPYTQSGAACPVAACPDGWVGYLGKCYYFSQAEGNWTYSRSHCSALGASLAVIGTQQEMVRPRFWDFLICYKGPSDHWISLWREPDQPWMWTNGTEFNNWCVPFSSINSVNVCLALP